MSISKTLLKAVGGESSSLAPVLGTGSRGRAPLKTSRALQSRYDDFLKRDAVREQQAVTDMFREQGRVSQNKYAMKNYRFEKSRGINYDESIPITSPTSNYQQFVDNNSGVNYRLLNPKNDHGKYLGHKNKQRILTGEGSTVTDPSVAEKLVRANYAVKQSYKDPRVNTNFTESQLPVDAQVTYTDHKGVSGFASGKTYEKQGLTAQQAYDQEFNRLNPNFDDNSRGLDALINKEGLSRYPKPIKGAEAEAYSPVALTSSRDYGEEYLAQRRELYPPSIQNQLEVNPSNTGFERGYGEYEPISLTSGIDYGEEYAAQQAEVARFGGKFRAKGLIEEAESTGSVVGLLRRQEAIREAAGGSVNQVTKGSVEDFEYKLLGNKIGEMNDASYYGPGGYGPRAQSRSQAAHSRLYDDDLYDEAVHMRNNNATSTNAMNGSANGPTPPSSSNTPINPATTPTGSTNYSGLYVPSQGNTASSVSALNMLNESGGAGIMASIGLGAVLGGSANYAMGGEFGEGAVMGGLAGGAMKIGARAIQANEASIENYLQRTALGDQFTSGMTREQAGRAIQDMSEAPEGLMRGMAYNVLRSEAPSVGMQSRYAVMGGSMLSGVAFTGRRNDKRRGFNAHRGNRI
jgi:hypothetical protein